MHPALRIVLALAGALIGSGVGSEGTQWVAALMGALAGLGFAELLQVRARLASLRADLQELRAGQAKARSAAPPAPPAPTAPPAPLGRAFEPYAPSSAAVPPAARVATPPPPAPRLPPVSPEPRVTPTPSAPRDYDPDPFAGSPWLGFLREYFTGGNTLVRAGVVVLFFGVAFLLRYLAEHTHVPIELRLTGVACGALVLLVIGWRLRNRRTGYALALQGGAMGILYLTVFSALRLYALLTPTAAFALLAAVSVFCAALAVLQNSLAVALLGVTGGFLAPMLASTGTGNYVALFSYYAVLNAAIVAIAWFRSWRWLNVAGFAFTFVLSTLWGVLQYRAQDFPSAEPFLVLFFLMYVGIAILFSTRQTAGTHAYIDGTIVFATPIAAFGLQAAMLHGQRFALAYSALAVSALYLTLAWLLHRRRGERQRLLVEAFMALGVAFLTLAVPLALDGRWSAASWSLEGAALIWVGCRQHRRLPRALGALLQLAAGGALALTMTADAHVPQGTYIAALMVGLASVYAAQVLHAHESELAEYEAGFSAVLFIWGLLWWCLGGWSEFRLHLDLRYELAAALAFATVTALGCSEMRRRFQMRIAVLPALALLPAMLLFALWAPGSEPHPLAYAGWASWPCAFGGLYLILWRYDALPARAAATAWHAVTLWLLAALLSWEAAWAIGTTVGSAGAWSAIAWGIVPAALLAWLPHLTRDVRWPFAAHRAAYRLLAGSGLAVYLGVWSIETNLQIASPSAPLRYLPLANPLDVVQAGVLVVLIRFWMGVRDEGYGKNLDERPVIGALALLGFIWLNAVLLRTLHQWAAIPYELQAMLTSTLVETALSIFWAVLALTTMLVATRLQSRVVWLVGAVLLVVVVGKLFLVDLSSIGTVERIVSFLGVGLLMLVLGYFSPLPPAAKPAP
jgi:uncharacterized membrane protein